jgi:hypothetical protein
MRALSGLSDRLMNNVGITNTDADNVVERSVIHRNSPDLDDSCIQHRIFSRRSILPTGNLATLC